MPGRNGANPSTTRTATAIAPNRTPAISPAGTAARAPRNRISPAPPARMSTESASEPQCTPGGAAPSPRRHHEGDDGYPVASAQSHAEDRDAEHRGDDKIGADDGL